MWARSFVRPEDLDCNKIINTPWKIDYNSQSISPHLVRLSQLSFCEFSQLFRHLPDVIAVILASVLVVVVAAAIRYDPRRRGGRSGVFRGIIAPPRDVAPFLRVGHHGGTSIRESSLIPCVVQFVLQISIIPRLCDTWHLSDFCTYSSKVRTRTSISHSLNIPWPLSFGREWCWAYIMLILVWIMQRTKKMPFLGKAMLLFFSFAYWITHPTKIETNAGAAKPAMRKGVKLNQERDANRQLSELKSLTN